MSSSSSAGAGAGQSGTSASSASGGQQHQAATVYYAIAPWGGVDESHPFEWMSNPDQTPPKLLPILACALLVFFILLNLPGLIARIVSNRKGGEAFNGFTLSRKAPRPVPSIMDSPSPMSNRSETFSRTDQDEDGISPTYPSPSRQIHENARSVESFTYGQPSRMSSSITLNRLVDPPKHVPSLASIIPFSGLLGVRLPGTSYTFGQGVVCAIWAALMGVGLFYDNSVVNQPVRAGFCAVNLLPIVFLLAEKVNWIGHLIGVGYEKLNFLHRFLGRLIFVASTFHGASYFVKWGKKGGMEYIAQASAKPFMTAGIVAWAAFAFIGITSIPVVRQRMYSFFWISHWIGIVTAFVALSFHKPYTGLFATIAMVIYAKDMILRWILKTRIVPATIIALPAPASDPASGSTQILLPLRSGWRAGQHVFIRIPALKEVGGMTFMENHPFTIGSAEGSELVLVAKKAGDWTRALYDYAAVGGVAGAPGKEVQGCDSVEDVDRYGEKRDVQMVERAVEVMGRKCKVMVEGPYGGPSSTVFASFAGIVLITGGSGITYGLSMLEDLIRKASEGHVRASSVHLVWVCKTYGDMAPFLAKMEDLCLRAEQTTLQPSITVYLSRSTARAKHMEGHIEIIGARPDIPTVVQSALRQLNREMLSGAVRGSGLVVGVCGPERLIDGARKAVRCLSWKEKRDIGGVDLHTESFGW
ncbi:hypothetical protein IAU60_000418 [Kwoniella sp. DSM 27419]